MQKIIRKSENMKYLQKRVYSRTPDGKQQISYQDRTVTVARRDKLRSTVCVGCRHNYYNQPKPQSLRGDVSVAEDEGCWYLENVNLRRKLPCLMKGIG